MNTTNEETPLDSGNSGDSATESATAVSDVAETEQTSDTESDSGKHEMSLEVEIEDAGPCRKHIRVTVPRSEIDHFYDEAVGEMLGTASVSGFRTGHVPRKLIEKRFRKELAAQVKQNVLMQSLEQVSERDDLDPINEPELNVDALEVPDEGDFEYEFDVEVRPDFSLPDYDGLTIRRPVGEVTAEDVENYRERYLGQYGRLVPHDGPAEPGDYLVLSVEFRHQGERLHRIGEFSARLRPVLRFQDAELSGFDELFAGATAGETRDTEITISTEAEPLEMRGETVEAHFTVEDVKRPQMPEMTHELLQSLGCESEEDLSDQIESVLRRQIEYRQRQSVRDQVLEKITESANWDLPEELVRRQTENALRREVLEMRQAGFTHQEVQARENEIRQKAVTETRQALKQHFILDKIAETENIEVTPADINEEITLMAMQQGESPRRLRARLTKSGMIDNLDAQLRERKAVDCILERATFEDVEMEPAIDTRVEAVSQSVCGLASETVEEAETEADETATTEAATGEAEATAESDNADDSAPA